MVTLFSIHCDEHPVNQINQGLDSVSAPWRNLFVLHVESISPRCDTQEGSEDLHLSMLDAQFDLSKSLIRCI